MPGLLKVPNKTIAVFLPNDDDGVCDFDKLNDVDNNEDDDSDGNDELDDDDASLQIIIFSEQVICQSRGKFWPDTKYIFSDNFIFICLILMYTVLSITMPHKYSYIVHCV